MITKEQGNTQVEGLTVYEVIIMVQMVEKLLRGGMVTGRELNHVNTLRGKMVGLVEQYTGFDLDNPNKGDKDE
jgi:hypothetical protein